MGLGSSAIGGARHSPTAARRRRPRCRDASRSPPTSGPTGCVWGATLRSPHPHARIAPARRAPARGASPASRRSSPPTTCPAQPPTASSAQDQPVFAATSCATSASRSPPSPPTTPRRAGGRCEAIVVEYEVLEPLIDPEEAIAGGHDRSIPTATCSATSASCAATRSVVGDVVVEGTYEIGMQDQAFLGLEAALGAARPGRRRRRAVHRHAVAARGPQADRGVPRPARGTRCASRSAAWAARSGPARTSACRCTCCLLALRHGPAGEDASTAATRASSATCTGTPAAIWMRHHATRRRHRS